MASKRKKSAVFKYFKEAEEINILLCQIKKEDGVICNMKISNKSSNLKCHLERQHINEFESVKENEKEDTHQRESREQDTSTSAPKKQSSLANYLQSEKESNNYYE